MSKSEHPSGQAFPKGVSFQSPTMNIALLGYGKMGREIEKTALSRGHQIKLVVDADNRSDLNCHNLKHLDAAIDFSVPSAAFANIMTCFEAGVPVVSGTTGWTEKLPEVIDFCLANDKCFFYASNFSVGVNIVFAVNAFLARLMRKRKEYTVSLKEIHHIQKLDSPSGTAISLANQLIGTLPGMEKWTANPSVQPGEIPIESVREGEVPGTHVITYASEIDAIQVIHEAKSRKGFALGAVLAAEFIAGCTGVFTMADLLRLEA